MGRVAFTEENVVKKGDYDFPRLRGLKKGEKARIVLLEEPWAEYVHNLRKPAVSDGEPVMTTRTLAKGGTVTENKMDFVSRPICLGDPGIVADKGSDPANCPMCKEAKDSDRVQAPQRRFAMHILKYATKPGTHEVQTPFSAQTMIWAFTDKVFGRIFEFKKEWEDLTKHDILLVCENELFQGYELSVSQKAAYRADRPTAEHALEIFRNNQTPDPAIFCGTPKEKRYVEMDLETIREAWALVKEYEARNGDGVTSTAPTSSQSLDTGLDDLLNSDKKAAPKAEEHKTQEDWAVSSTDLEDLIGSDPAKDEKKADAPEGDDFDSLLEKEKPAAKATKSAPADEDLDDLLNGITG
jgi:hypothetical protein